MQTSVKYNFTCVTCVNLKTFDIFLYLRTDKNQEISANDLNYILFSISLLISAVIIK